MTLEQARDKQFKEHGPRHFDDWNTERNYYDMAVEKMMTPPPSRPLYSRENDPGQELGEIERDNVKAAQSGRD